MTVTGIVFALALLTPGQMPESEGSVKDKAKAQMDRLGLEEAEDQRAEKARRAKKAKKEARGAKRKAHKDARQEQRDAKKALREERREARKAERKGAKAERAGRREARQARRARAKERAQAAKERVRAVDKSRMGDARREMRTHLRRMAKLDRIRELAREVDDPETEKRAEALIAKENERHEIRMKVFERPVEKKAPAEETEDSEESEEDSP